MEKLFHLVSLIKMLWFSFRIDGKCLTLGCHVQTNTNCRSLFCKIFSFHLSFSKSFRNIFFHISYSSLKIFFTITSKNQMLLHFVSFCWHENLKSASPDQIVRIRMNCPLGIFFITWCEWYDFEFRHRGVSRF